MNTRDMNYIDDNLPSNKRIKAESTGLITQSEKLKSKDDRIEIKIEISETQKI